MAERKRAAGAPEFWPTVRIAAEVNRKRRSRGSRGGRNDEESPSYTPIRFDTALVPELGPEAFTLASGGAEVVAWDADGDAVVRGALGGAGEQRPMNPRGEALRSGRLGHFVYLSQGEHTFALDSFAENTNETLQMWSRPGGGSAVEVTLGRGIAGHAFNPRDTKLLVATPNGVVLESPGAVYCVHPITGELAWYRRTLHSKFEALADGERVFLMPDDRSQGQILAIADGADLGSWQPPDGMWISSVGRRLATEQRTAKGVLLQVVDLATTAAEVQLEMPAGTHTVSFGPGWVAALAPSGRLEVIDVGSAAVAFSRQLRAEPNLVSLDAVPIGGQIYLLANTLNDAEQNVAGFIAPPGQSPVTGRLYALDADSGSLVWPAPVRLTGRVVLPLQPPSSPALILTSYRMSPETDTGEAVVELLALDKLTGQSLYRSERFPHSTQDQIVVRMNRRPEVTVNIDSRLWEVRLRPTSASRSPEPVADDEVESIGTQDKDGLWGVGRQLGRILEGVLPGANER
jgi:outer membrane protein assembly factor BamB